MNYRKILDDHIQESLQEVEYETDEEKMKSVKETVLKYQYLVMKINHILQKKKTIN